MLENLSPIRNPLTIIALFAGLAEVAATAALATVEPTLQSTFVWFVMGFPVLLVIAFFLTLNFNARVLYAPSDFQDEGNFLRMLEMATTAAEQLRSLKQDLTVDKSENSGAGSQAGAGAGPEQREALNKKLAEVQSAVSVMRQGLLRAYAGSTDARRIWLCPKCQTYVSPHFSEEAGCLICPHCQHQEPVA